VSEKIIHEDQHKTDHLPLRLAFYLPQFHQTPENDAWHGAGFTEWSVVAQSRPLFPGHFQPRLPGELGFYDLRLPETRELQARLARSHGISGFCYYHYWFKGRRMLERPFREVLRSGKPDFPFCLCWANESWYRRWQGSADELVIEQDFDEEDDVEHIRWMIEAFRDERYIRVKGRPLLTIYRPQDLPEPKRTVEIWSEECAKAGVPPPWLVGFETRGNVVDPAEIGFDASAEFVPHGVNDLLTTMDLPALCDPSNTVFDYSQVASAYASRPEPSWTRYPCVATGWDNTPRRRNGEALILLGSTPDRYRVWLERAMQGQLHSQGEDGVVFVNAWNEWAEGAHLEPDAQNGRAYLEATRDVVESLGGSGQSPSSNGDGEEPAPASIEDLYADLYENFVLLQNRSSGYLAIADRRLQSWRDYYDKELEKQREQNRSLAEWCLSLEQQIAFLMGQGEEFAPPIDPGEIVGSSTTRGDSSGT
jgi:Glycosyltransferase WbsX